MSEQMQVAMIEALVVEKDEFLMIRIPPGHSPSLAEEVRERLLEIGLERFAIFSGEVEFTKVKL